MGSKASQKRSGTGTRDETYNLVSVLYHALQGAETCEQYLKDAEKAGDQTLAQFFRDCQENHRTTAERAKNLLGTKMHSPNAGFPFEDTGGARDKARATTNASVRSGGNATDDCVDESSKESFPASDAPGSY